MSKIYTQSQIVDFIEKAFGIGKTFNQGKNIQVVCPICKTHKRDGYSKRKLAIKLVGQHLTHCWVCGYKNRTILGLLQKHNPRMVSEYKNRFLNAEDLSAVRQEDEAVKRPVHLPEGFQLLATADDRDDIVQVATKYLKSRGLASMRDLWYWKFGVTESTVDGCKYRIIIPSYDHEGTLNYWSARSWIKNPTRYIGKYKNPEAEKTQIIFNENNIDWNEELTIVEGPFDLFKCNENCTAALGSELDANYKLFQEILHHKTPVLLAFDNEFAAQRKQFKIAETLSEFDIPVRILENPHRNKDVGDLTKSEFNTLRKCAKVFSGDYLLRRKIAGIV